MQQISAIWVGNPFFYAGLADLGWHIVWINPPTGTVLTWDEIVAEAGFTPDVLIVADKSLPPFVVGMETFPCVTVFYAVDTHIHSWFPLYAQGFDIVLVSLRDHLSFFLGARHTTETLWWSPPFAKNEDIPKGPAPEKPLWDVLFVGKIDPAVNEERHIFFTKLAPLVPGLHITSGSYCDLYPQAKIVLNHAIQNDLNFRVFEALGCGACLVTPIVGHGLVELFRDEQDLFLYDQQDIPGLAALLVSLLAAPEKCREVGKNGHAAILAGQYMHHRANTFAAKIEHMLASGQASKIIQTRIHSAKDILASWLRLIYLLHAETTVAPEAKNRYLQAARG